MSTRNKTMRTLLLASVLALPGCTLIADVDAYKTDEGCDLNMSLTDFSAHFSGPHRMEFLVVRLDTANADGGVPANPNGNLASVLVLEPTPAINFDIDMPNAIPNRQHEIRFYADTNNNDILEPLINGMRQDHTWILTSVCDPQPIPFVHVFNFQDFGEPSPIGTDLRVRVSAIPEAGGAFELRVIVRDVPDPTKPAVFVERTIGAFHKPKRDDGAGTDADPFIVRIPGIIDSGVDYTFEVWADGNGNGTFDRNEDGGPFSGTDDRYWRIQVGGMDLDDPLVPFEFDVATPAIMGQNEHSGILVVTPH